MDVPPGDLSVALNDAFGAARSVWPEVAVPDDAFAAYLIARAGGPDVSRLHVADLYLACGCVRRDAAAIAIFDREFLAPIPAILARGGTPAEVGTEVIQVLRERLLVGDRQRPPRIADYSGRGPLAGWLRVASVREASKVFRHERVHASLRPDDLPPAATPEEATIRARYGGAFREAFRDAFRALAAEERLLLRLHFAEGLNLDGLAVALGFSRATAGRRIVAARTQLRDETLRILGERLDATPDEVSSVLAALRSRLEITFGELVSAA
jgi:RNA polymerase sigma-70 factor (ECF subfamily)